MKTQNNVEEYISGRIISLWYSCQLKTLVKKRKAVSCFKNQKKSCCFLLLSWYKTSSWRKEPQDKKGCSVVQEWCCFWRTGSFRRRSVVQKNKVFFCSEPFFFSERFFRNEPFRRIPKGLPLKEEPHLFFYSQASLLLWRAEQQNSISYSDSSRKEAEQLQTCRIQIHWVIVMKSSTFVLFSCEPMFCCLLALLVSRRKTQEEHHSWRKQGVVSSSSTQKNS